MSRCRIAAKPINRLVGVVATNADLKKAMRLRKRPDFFELRLDALCYYPEEIEQAMVERRRAEDAYTEANPNPADIKEKFERMRRQTAPRRT